MPVLIEKITVEGGFLDGLDLTLRPGLNTLIGPRGAGKTSVIELLRFALDVPKVIEEEAASSRQHALSVLGDGRVTVVVSSDGDRLTFSRSGDDESASLSIGALPSLPLMLGQGEIERVALNAAGRLRIIDDFVHRPVAGSAPGPQLSLIRSQTTQLRDMRSEIAGLRQGLAELDEVKAALASAEVDEKRMRTSVAAAASDLARLDELGRTTAAEVVKRSVLERSGDLLDAWGIEIEQLVRRVPVLENAEEAAGDEGALAKARTRVAEVATALDQAVARLGDTVSDLRRNMALVQQTIDKLNAESTELRARVESVREGAGAAARNLAHLRERIAQLEATAQLADQRERAAEELRVERDQLLGDLDRMRDERWVQRKSVADFLNKNLGPTIDVQVRKGAIHTAYVTALAGSLRGSGLQYNALAPQIAQNLSPRELVDAVDAEDVHALSNVLDISVERARRLVEHLRDDGMADVLAASIEDGVQFGLWNGATHRETQVLSTGQRCTVVLPMLLLHTERPVVVDQPEDNLDNAFIVETLVDVLAARGGSGQVICATHNPNIPVLGNAAYVVEMDADGKRGFARTQGALEDPAIVDAITKVMEGGREAFARRAAFYGVP